MTATDPVATQYQAASKPRARGWFSNSARLRESLTGWLFISPAVILIFLFGLFPIGYAFYMSLHNWRIRQGAFLCDGEAGDAIAILRSCLRNYERVLGDWGGAGLLVLGLITIGLAFFVWTRLFASRHETSFAILRVIAGLFVLAVAFALITVGYNAMLDALPRRDVPFLVGLEITLYYAFGAIPIQLALGLILAYVLFHHVKFKGIFRTIFFLPYVTPTVAAAVVFGIVFSGRTTSPINQLMTTLGLDTQRWLSEPTPILNLLFGWNLKGFLAGPSLALVCVIIQGIWTYTGYNAVIFMAGLGNIPGDLYEAARVDGASEWHLFRYITLPLLSPVTFYLSLLGFIGTFTAFNTLFVMRTPATQGTLDSSALVIFDTFRVRNEWSIATAQAIVLLLIVMAMTMVQRRVFEKRVFYG